MFERISSVPKNSKKEKNRQQEKNRLKDENQIVIINNIQPPSNHEPELRTINLYGDITEQKGADVVAALLYLENNAHISMLRDPTNPESEEVTVSRSISMMP